MTTWNSAFEASPADTDAAEYGAQKIRELKTAISERLETEMNFKTGGQPLLKAGVAAVLYSGVTASITALTGMSAGALAWDTTLLVFKRYNGATWDVLSSTTSLIPAGTVMLFLQAAAPTGWTQVTAYNDKVLRLVNDNSGAAVGGSWTITGITGGSHALTIAELAAHTHTVSLVLASGGAGGNPSGGTWHSSTVTSSSQGSGTAHDHGASTSDGTWRPAYQNIIACSKN